MSRIKYFLCGLLLTAVMQGCNDDIFADREPVIEDILLDGNGGRSTFRIRKKALRAIDIDCPSVGTFYQTVRFYGKDGVLIEGVPEIDDVAKVRFETLSCVVDFLVDGDEVTAVGVDNTQSSDIYINVYLDYGATAVGFGITLTPGEPMRIEGLGYTEEPDETYTETQTGMRQSLSNNTSLTQRMTIRPYADAVATAEYETDEEWTNGARGYVPVPYYSDGGWIVPYDPSVDIEVGKVSQYRACGIDPDETVVIDVPPFTKTTVQVTLTYAVYITPFAAAFVMPNSGISNMTFGTCRIKQPVEYNIEKECEEL